MMVRLLPPHLLRGRTQALIGQCILTVGTDDRPIAYRGRVKLLPSHCYAVIGLSLHLPCWQLLINASKDVNETEGGSRWLTILDSWLPADKSTEVDALLDDLSLDDEGRGQRRRDNPVLSHKLRSSPFRFHRYTMGRCLYSVWKYMPQLESGNVQEPASLPRVSTRYPSQSPASHYDPGFGEPFIYHQSNEMDVRRLMVTFL